VSRCGRFIGIPLVDERVPWHLEMMANVRRDRPQQTAIAAVDAPDSSRSPRTNGFETGDQPRVSFSSRPRSDRLSVSVIRMLRTARGAPVMLALL
jgi:hypothetical protein